MSDDDRRVEEINETDLEGTAAEPRQRSARNDPGMRDGDNSHGNPYPETWEEDPQEDSDADVGDTTPSLTSEEFGVLDSIPANESGETQAIDREADEVGPVPPSSGGAGRPADRSTVAESRRSRPDGPGGDLPLDNYPALTIPQIFEKIPSLSNDEVRAIRDYEKSHRRRKTLLVKLERHLRPTEGPPRPTDRSQLR